MVYTSSQRLSGYTKAYQVAGMEVNPSLMEYSYYTVEGGYEAFMRIIKRNPDMTAAFVTNYEMTLGSIIAINELSLKIPGDLSFIGFDNIELAKVVKPKLTIVSQPMEQIGKAAAIQMLQRMKGEYVSSNIIIKSTEFIIGDSVADLY